MNAPFGNFSAVHPALEVIDQLADPVARRLNDPQVREAAETVVYVDTDPANADTAVFCEAYGVPMEVSANCVVVAAKRAGETTMAACLALAHTRVDVNKAVRKYLDARKASFASVEQAVAETGMEYGGITPIGLPASWPVLVDEDVAATPYVLIGSGRRRGKLILPGDAVSVLARADVLPCQAP